MQAPDRRCCHRQLGDAEPPGVSYVFGSFCLPIGDLMAIDHRGFLKNYVAAVREDQAALFVGAGLSRPAGFVDWKGLLRECAEELGVDLDREHDLIAVAQYYLNRRHRDRSGLNQLLKNEFDKPAVLTPNHRIIARLPISTIWTTNFDSVLETALSAAGRKVDLKSRDQDLALHRKGRDVVLYKMHGDIARPDEIVISKEDYERYAKRHPVLQNALEGDLVTKTFLFVGFSFTDPHLDYMLGHLDTLLEGSKREHYAVMRRARRDWHRKHDDDAQRAFEYDLNRQALQVEDPQRYGIQTLLVDQYEEVTQLLETIEQRLYLEHVFVSGSAHEFGEFEENRMRDFCMHLGEKLVDRRMHIVCGMGLNVGDAVVKGALVKLFAMRDTSIEHYLSLSPFPRNLPADVSESEFNQAYREGMIKNAGIAIFIAGTSRSARESIGVLKEFEIARSMGKILIPVGATGFAARRIWRQINENLDRAYGGAVSQELFDRLNRIDLSNDRLLDAIFEVIDAVTDPVMARRAGQREAPLPGFAS